MNRKSAIFGLSLLGAAASAGSSNVVIEAEDTPAALIADGILRRQRINFVYSNSRLGIGTNRPSRIEIYVSKAARPAKADPSENARSAGSTREGVDADQPADGDDEERSSERAAGEDAAGTNVGGRADAVDDGAAAGR